MPTPLGHALAGAGAWLAVHRGSAPRSLPKIAVACAVGMLADIDFGLAPLASSPGTFHHSITHSVGAAAIVSCLVVVAVRLRRHPDAGRTAAALILAYASHLGLDYLSMDTSFPYGIELLWPFSTRYFISPVQIFADVYRGSAYALFGTHNLLAALREVAILVPIVGGIWWVRRGKAL